MQARLTAGAAWASRQCQEMAYVEAIGTPTQLNPWAGRAAIQSAATTSVDRKTHLANSAYGVRLRGRNKEGEHEGQESHESQVTAAEMDDRKWMRPKMTHRRPSQTLSIEARNTSRQATQQGPAKATDEKERGEEKKTTR